MNRRHFIQRAAASVFGVLAATYVPISLRSDWWPSEVVEVCYCGGVQAVKKTEHGSTKYCSSCGTTLVEFSVPKRSESDLMWFSRVDDPAGMWGE